MGLDNDRVDRRIQLSFSDWENRGALIAVEPPLGIIVALLGFAVPLVTTVALVVSHPLVPALEKQSI
jgi:hypothetical protein